MSAVNIGKRILLLVANVLVSFGVVVVFLKGGTGIPIALFGSWGYVLISHLDLSPMLLTTTYLLYSSILSFAGTAQARLTKWRYPVLSLAGHGIGCYAALLSLTRPSVGFISWWWLAEFLVPVSMVVLYILADWSLAKGGKRPLAPNLSTGPRPPTTPDYCALPHP
jgi:hypothetical protein